MQQLENFRVTHQSQVTRRGLSYESVVFYSATAPGETFHYAKRFMIVQEEGPSEALFDKEPNPSPPGIHNLTAPLSAPGDPIEDGIFIDSNQA